MPESERKQSTSVTADVMDPNRTNDHGRKASVSIAIDDEGAPVVYVDGRKWEPAVRVIGESPILYLCLRPAR